MILPGHLAAAYLASQATQADTSGAMAASMAADLVDKPVRWVLRLTPNDRLPAHTALAWALSTWAAHHWRGDRFAAGWAVGYGAHLLCDYANSFLNPGRIYFWWPFRRYALHRGPIGLSSSLGDFSSASLLLEGLLACLGLAHWLARRPAPTSR